MILNKQKKIQYFFYIVFALSIIGSLIIFPFSLHQPTYGQTLQEQLEELQTQIDEIQQSKENIQVEIEKNEQVINSYSSEAATIYEEILLFQKDIEQLELNIRELEITIEIIEEDIFEKQNEIEEKQKNITELEDQSNERIKSNYFNYRLFGSNDTFSDSFLNIDSVNTFFKDSQYKEIIQKQTNELMRELAILKTELESTKVELDAQLVELNKERDNLDIRRDDLAKQQDELLAKRDIYFREISAIQNTINNKELQILAFSEEEAQKLSEVDRITQQLFNSFAPTGEGDFVAAGKIIGRQGATGFATGPHLHFIVWENGSIQNPCSYLSGCVNSGTLSSPVDANPILTSGFGERCFSWGGSDYCDFHNGVDLVTSPWNGAIYAAHDGYIYKGVDEYGALYVILCSESNCQSGIKTGYWHLSEY